jgi:hypothetical protein
MGVRVNWRTILGAVLLVALNRYTSGRLIRTEYNQWMGSIEGAYIGLSRYILEHGWAGLGWFPLWYGGIPFPNAYPPLLHVVVAVWAGLAGVSTALAHHAVSAVAYCLGPAALFWWTARLAGSRRAGLVAGLLFSAVSFSAAIPSVRLDMPDAFAPRRFQALGGYGEGPHVASMTLVPLALVALDSALRRGRWRWALAAVAMAAVPLTNWLGAFALACAVFAYWLAMPEARWRPIFAVAAAAYALASPWIPPSTIVDVQHNARVLGGYPMGPAQYAYLALLVAGSVGLSRLPARPAIKFALVWLLWMGLPPVTAFNWKIYAMPQSERYHLELEMAVAMALAAAVPGRWLTTAVALAAGVALVQAPRWRAFANTDVVAIDIDRSYEREIARELATRYPGQRIHATGSAQFWINAFSDQPLLGGGFFQGIHNRRVVDAAFAVPFPGDSAAKAVAILQTFGVRAIVVGGPDSRDQFRDFPNPRKYDGVLKEVWRKGDDAILEVPGTGRLAHVVRRDQVVREWNPDLIRDYASSVQSPTAEWRDGVIEATVGADQVVSVQTSFHSGWRASVDGGPCGVSPDGAGQVLVDCGRAGPLRIRFEFDGGVELLLARVAAAAAAVALAVVSVRPPSPPGNCL